MKKLSDRARYEYALESVRDRIEELRRRVGRAALYYSMKANHYPGVVAEIARSGCMEAEVCSTGELMAAAAAGFRISRIIYGGPGKRQEDIEYAFDMGVRRFSIESLNELAIVESMERTMNLCCFKILRVAPPSPSTAGLSMAGPTSKFGLTVEEIERLSPASRAAIDGLHVYYGSQVSETDCFGTHVERIKELVARLQPLLPNLGLINYGGGLAWPYLAEGEARITSEGPPDTLTGLDAAFEFGRYVVASCGTLRTRVLDVKMRNDTQVIITESGLNHLAGIAATGRILKSKVSIRVEGDDSAAGSYIPSAVYGPLCTPLDYVDLSVSMPHVDVGDVLCIPNAGAYAYETRMADFLLRDEVKQICV